MIESSEYMKITFLSLVVTTAMLSGCAEAMHRYGAHPFGEDTTYNVVYAYSSPSELYECVSDELSKKSYSIENGWPDTKETESYFVIKNDKEVARYDFDGRNMKVTGTQVSVLTPSSGQKEFFYAILKRCVDKTE